MIKSNEATIEQMNEAIAKFIGDHREKQWEAGMPLKYHTSWDWLMPVWTKFRQLMKPGSNDMFDEWVNSLGYYLLSSERPDRFCERLYYAIQWYQHQTTTNER